MISKAFGILRQNPVLIYAYIAFGLLTGIIMYFFMVPRFDRYDLTQILMELFRMLLVYLLVFILGLLFLSGFAHMTAQAVMKGNTSIGEFLTGIKRFLGRLLLSLLLLMAIVIALSIVISIVSIPITMILTLSSADPEFAAARAALIMTPVVILFLIALIPFFILWFPALFIDNAGVIDSLKSGMKAGVKSYGILFFWTAVLYLPSLIYTMINYENIQAGITVTPGYFVMMIVSAVLSLFYFIMIFVLYNEKRIKPFISN